MRRSDASNNEESVRRVEVVAIVRPEHDVDFFSCRCVHIVYYSYEAQNALSLYDFTKIKSGCPSPVMSGTGVGP